MLSVGTSPLQLSDEVAFHALVSDEVAVTPGQITGLVWNDENRNGIRDEGERTLSSVVVQLLDENFQEVAVTSSDGTGRYEFTGVVPGQYSVFVERRQMLEFAPQDAGGTDEYDSDVDPISGIASGVNVTSGAVVSNLDAGLFSPLQNPANKLDVNGDDQVSPIDALIVIDWLNSAAGIASPDAPPYRDVSGDGYVSPLDVLFVIKHLTDSGVNPPPVSPDVPVLLSPSDGAVVSTSTVTLSFQPLAGYTGDYLVRLDDQQWDGIQAAGFQHDTTAHYLSLSTKQTSVTVPVRVGHTYRWWVHKPDFEAAERTFVVDGIDLTSIPNAPPADQIFAPILIDGRYRATAMQQWSNRQVDVSGALQQWIDQLPVGATLELPAGKYLVNNQVIIRQRITLTSIGKSLGDPACDESAGDCAELIATRGLNQPYGILRMDQVEALHHIVLNGNKQSRQGTLAYDKVASGKDNRYGFNARLTSDNCIIEGNIFKNALGGTGLEVAGSRFAVEIRSNLFAYNGVHTTRNFWADGLTAHDLRDSRIENNEFIDNTDIDLILGGGRNCIIRGNHILHTSDRAGGAFAGLMIHKWSSTSGDYTGVDVSGNVIDGGPNRDIGSGIYLASEGWYDETPVGSLVPGQVAAIHDNIVRNTKNGMYIAASRFQVYANEYSNTHGVAFRSSGGTLTSLAPVVVSPTASWIDFRGENLDPTTQHLFAVQNWRGCIPNWPF